jgi:hypothetical protein
MFTYTHIYICLVAVFFPFKITEKVDLRAVFRLVFGRCLVQILSWLPVNKALNVFSVAFDEWQNSAF